VKRVAPLLLASEHLRTKHDYASRTFGRCPILCEVKSFLILVTFGCTAKCPQDRGQAERHAKKHENESEPDQKISDGIKMTYLGEQRDNQDCRFQILLTIPFEKWLRRFFPKDVRRGDLRSCRKRSQTMSQSILPCEHTTWVSSVLFLRVLSSATFWRLSTTPKMERRSGGRPSNDDRRETADTNESQSFHND
jgi:hypothetical protein